MHSFGFPPPKNERMSRSALARWAKVRCQINDHGFLDCPRRGGSVHFDNDVVGQIEFCPFCGRVLGGGA